MKKILFTAVMAAVMSSLASGADQPKPLTPSKTEKNISLEMLMIEVDVDSCKAYSQLMGEESRVDLTREKAASLMKQLQSHPQVSILTSPRLVLTENQTGFFEVGQNHPYVRSLTTKLVNGVAVTTPEMGSASGGLTCRYTPVLSTDKKSVLLRAEINNVVLGNRILTPVTMMIPAVETSNGEKTEAIPFTQFLEQPVLDTQKLETLLSIRDGEAMMVQVARSKRMAKFENRLPFFDRVPYLNRLMRIRSEKEITIDTVAILTVNILKDAPAVVPPQQAVTTARPIPAPPMPKPAPLQQIPNAVPVTIAQLSQPIAVRIGPDPDALVWIVEEKPITPQAVARMFPSAPVAPVSAVPPISVSVVPPNRAHMPMPAPVAQMPIVQPNPVAMVRPVAPTPVPVPAPVARVVVQEVVPQVPGFVRILAEESPTVPFVVVGRPMAPMPASVAQMPVVAPTPVGFIQRTIGPDGYERIGVDFTKPCPTHGAICESPTPPAPVASRFRMIRHVEADGGVNLALEEVPTLQKKCAVDPLMEEYRAACKAGNKAEAARLALQLLAKDPICFGRD